jgi:fructuronate reductase
VSDRLHPQRLAQVPAGIRRPAYDRHAHGVGIVHLGIGAFHRAHQAVYLDDVLARAGDDWRILGVSMRSGAVREQLHPQDCLYTVVERSAASADYRIIGSVADVLVASANPMAVIAAMVRTTTELITLTITEKGYCRNAVGGLDLNHPDIFHDLAQPEHPRGALGLLALALRQRWRLKTGAPTLICCDNLPENGVVLKRVLLEYAQQLESALAAWIEREVVCPSTMVDRIVPATTADDLAMGAQAIGLSDLGLVKTEPFTQWVIENRFAGARPDFEVAGVQLVSDVRPFETAKLRLLNGSHSTLAYLGSLAGLSFVHEAIAEPDFLALLQHLMHSELAPTLARSPDLDLVAYQAALLRRFANPALQHRLRQIAMDGSQKLPQRLLEPLRARLRAGQPFPALALAIAAWMRFALGRDEAGIAYELDDPLAARLAAIAGMRGAGAVQLTVRFLQLSEVFGEDLPQNPTVVTAVSRQLERLLTHGARAAVRSLLAELPIQQ